MSTEFKKEIELEIAHVLFLDLAGYSKLSTDEQHATLGEVNLLQPRISRSSTLSG